MSDFLALFDVDGTLVDSQGIIVATMARAFEKSDLPPPDPHRVRRLIGLSLPRMIADLAEGQSAETIGRIMADYRLGFASALEEQGQRPALFPGVQEGLDALTARGVVLGVATGKSKRGLDRLIHEQGWEDRFATLQCADFHPSKPHPSMVRTALAETDIDPSRTVMIGDSVFDIDMGLAGGVVPLGVSWGYGAPEDLTAAGAAKVATTFEQLVQIILERAA
ncbi:haloacid dehalogenase [Jannaschia pagri]|uniref:Haloacid dehalogenase n=1 Tax=Jannaschia pagri TaxID=2829797 RepID=A0ABQ4NHD0_9RHOB|nr:MULTISPECIES: HAD-IA family hydrolase [unclassified Jannaschia]GIT90309.1 haloacid dehalogenase [Jannaschia sp. AI_61]GIT93585.1 haloacid dehalogenase [Jannaschia sp. AI_62]